MRLLLQDIRYGLRQLRKAPGFTLTAVLTLALGIGATTALFSVVHSVLLEPLQYRDNGRLVVIWERVRFIEKLAPYLGANPRHEDLWRRQATAFSDLTLLQQNSVGLGLSGDHPYLVGRILGQANLLDVLGVQPLLGRNFLPEETVRGHEKVAIISYRIWQDLFKGDSGVLGKTVQLAGSPVQIVGVLPANFYFPKPNELSALPVAGQFPAAEIITPLTIDMSEFGWNSDYGNYVALGHLKPGISIAQATQGLNVLAEDIVRQIPPNQTDSNSPGALGVYVQPLKEVIVGRSAARLWLLMAAVFSVLLIACINLANAQLARVIRRDREAAVRSALGASAGDLLQSALAEICILSLAGASIGVALAVFAVHRFARYAQLAVPRTGSIVVDPTVLCVSLLLTVGATCIFGLLPALRVLRANPRQVLPGFARSSGSRETRRLWGWLVGLQVFASTALLLVAGLFAKSLVHLSATDRGFSAENVIAADVLLQGNSFSQEKERAAFDDALLMKLRALPGVQSASLVSYMLLAGESWMDGIIPEDGAPADTGALSNYRWIGPGYFSTLQQRIVMGRALDEHDRTTGSAVISEHVARTIWPNQNPLNHHFKKNGHSLTVVGVAADARSNSLLTEPANMVYLPYWDNPPYTPYFLLRTAHDPASFTEAVRKTIWSVDPTVTIARIHTLRSQVNESLAPEHLETGILTAFGGAALVLALLGIYGTLSYSVEARTQEIGIRIALGASRESVYKLMLGTVRSPVFIGLAAGYLVSLGVGRSLRAYLYGTSPVEFSLVIPILATFAVLAIVATSVPCSRAASIEPMQALKSE